MPGPTEFSNIMIFDLGKNQIHSTAHLNFEFRKKNLHKSTSNSNVCEEKLINTKTFSQAKT